MKKKADLDLLIVKMKTFTPYEFGRKLRSLIDDLKRWKAVKYRMFLLSVGVFVLKDIVLGNCEILLKKLNCYGLRNQESS